MKIKPIYFVYVLTVLVIISIIVGIDDNNQEQLITTDNISTENLGLIDNFKSRIYDKNLKLNYILKSPLAIEKKNQSELEKPTLEIYNFDEVLIWTIVANKSIMKDTMINFTGNAQVISNLKTDKLKSEKFSIDLDSNVIFSNNGIIYTTSSSISNAQTMELHIEKDLLTLSKVLTKYAK